MGYRIRGRDLPGMLLCCWVGMILGLPAIVAADWRVLSQAALEETFDSNIYLRPDHETSDFITTALIDGGVENVTASRTLAAHYVLGLNHFYRHSSNNFVGHTAALNWDQRLTRNFAWHLRDTFYKSEEPLEEDPTITAVRRTRNAYHRNTADTGFSYQFGPGNRVTASYTDSRLQNKDPEVEDNLEYGPLFGVEYWLTPSHGLALGYTWHRIEYEVTDPREIQTATAGYLWRWSPRRTVHLDYVQEQFSSQDPGEEDYLVHGFMAGIDEALSPRWNLTGSVGYYVLDPEDSSGDDGFLYSVGVTRTFARGALSLVGSGGYVLEYTDAENRGFMEYREISATFHYGLTARTEVFASGSYRHEQGAGGQRTVGDVQTRDRNEFFGCAVGASYRLADWLTGEMQLEQRDRSSSEADSEYRDSLLVLRLRGTYEWR